MKSLTSAFRMSDPEPKFPAVCPRCGAAIGHNPETDVKKHFERAHSGLIGTAFKDGAEWFDFAFLMPVSGRTDRRWYVVAFSWPFGVVSIQPDDYEIRWRATSPVTY